jgi:hypothetical protein
MFEQERHRAADQSPGCRRWNRLSLDRPIDGRLGGYPLEKGYTLEKGHSLEESSYIVHSPPPPRRREPKCPQLRLR